jgi:hypothetical protein
VRLSVLEVVPYKVGRRTTKFGSTVTMDMTPWGRRTTNTKPATKEKEAIEGGIGETAKDQFTGSSNRNNEK